MRKVLVTGGAGFVGTNFCHYWAKKYDKDLIVVLDVLNYAGVRKNLYPLELKGKRSTNPI